MHEPTYYEKNALPSDIRDLMLKTFGLIHEVDVDVLSATKHRGRARWKIPSVIVGSERYYRVEDLKRLVDDKYQASAENKTDTTPLA